MNSNLNEVISSVFNLPDAPYIDHEFKPDHIVHVLLTLDPMSVQNPPSRRVCFSTYITRHYLSDVSIKAFIDDLAAYPTGSRGPRFVDSYQPSVNSPFDIGICKQCYVVLELEYSWNWQFQSGSRGCNTKYNYDDDNIDLRWATPKSQDQSSKQSIPDGCKIIYFSARRRPEQSKENSSQGFNFLIEFIDKPNQMSNSERLKTIFDPDIKNDGGEEWPTGGGVIGPKVK